MKEMDLSYNDLSSLSGDLLACGVYQLERAILHHTNISDYSTLKILKKVMDKSRLKHLDIGGDLRAIDPQVIAQSFNRLNFVTINTEMTHLNKMTILQLFQVMSHQTTLKRMDFAYRDLSSVPSQIFAEAVTNIEEVILLETKLTMDQILKTFQKMTKKKILQYLDIRGCSLEGVTKDLFLGARENCHFILHDYDSDVLPKIFISDTREFGNKRKIV